MDWKRVSAELAKPLNPDAVKPPPKGKYGEYVDALHVIREANRVFGFNGWSYDVASLVPTNATLENGMHHIGYMATVRVVIDGVSRCDVGHGQGHGKSEGDAHDSAVKEAVTDALKRALRTFGNTFGLALYEKDKAAREVGYSADANEIDAAVASIESVASLPDLQAHWRALNADMHHVAADQVVIAAKDRRKAALQNAATGTPGAFDDATQEILAQTAASLTDADGAEPPF